MPTIPNNVFNLNPEIDYQEKQITSLIKQLSDMYLACCFSIVITDNKSNLIEINHRWISEQAKQNYDDMQMILGELLKRRYNLK